VALCYRFTGTVDRAGRYLICLVRSRLGIGGSPLLATVRLIVQNLPPEHAKQCLRSAKSARWLASKLAAMAKGHTFVNADTLVEAASGDLEVGVGDDLPCWNLGASIAWNAQNGETAIRIDFQELTQT
jgi:hypothetical protein